MLISYRGEIGEPVARQVEMFKQTILEQLKIRPIISTANDAEELSPILNHSYGQEASCHSYWC